MDAYEAGHDNSLTANATKSLGNPYDLMASHQLTSMFIHGYGLDNKYKITVTTHPIFNVMKLFSVQKSTYVGPTY